jgi:hypothetical protein
MPDYSPLYSAAGAQSNIDPLLLQSMANEESDEGRNMGPSSAGAIGFMQFLPPTAQQYGVNPNDTTSSVFGAARYMDDLMNQHGQNLSQALAKYGGTTPDSPYVKKVINNYTNLQQAWAGRQRNFTPPASAPDTFSLQQGSAGQPDAKTLTTGNQSDAGASFSMNEPPPPAPAKGKGAAPAATPGIGGLTPDVDEGGKPLKPAEAAPSSGGIQGLQPDVQETGAPIAKPGQQYLTAATSPGAQATGTPIAEGQVPGAAFQAKINLATDPGQKARIAADQLGVPLDRIIIGPGGRMAAVNDQGQPYYIEPQPVFNDQSGTTRGEPGTPWQPTSPFFVSPYSRAEPLGPGATPGNIPLAVGGAIPSTVQNALTYAPMALGNPLVGGTLTGLASQAATSGRQYLANQLDPNASLAPTASPTPESLKEAGINALTAAGLRVGGALFKPAAMSPRGTAGAEAPIPTSPVPVQGLGGWPLPFSRLGGGIGEEQTAALAGQTQFPGREPMPVGPATSVAPGGAATGTAVAVGAPGVQLNPAGEAAATSGPYAPSTPEEIRAIPNAMPPSRMPILTQAQAEARADQIIRHFAANGPVDADTRTLVPGSPGTLAQITGNAGLATLERLVRNIPEMANTFGAVDTAQQNARREFIGQLIGTPEDVARLESERAAATSQAREAAFANTTPTDPSGTVAAIDQVLSGPAGKRPGIALPLRQIRGLFYTVDPATGAQVLDTDPEMLYGVRQAITDALSPLSRGTDRDARAASAQLQPILRSLDAAIEAGAPGYQDYLKQFSEMSQPIDAMRYLQSRNLTDTAGNPSLRPVDTMLKDISKQRNLQPGVRPADALSDDQITALENLRDDMRRQANLAKGKALGSNTAQNLVGNQALSMLTRPAAQETGKMFSVFGGPIAYAATAGAENLLSSMVGRRADWVREALVRRLLNQNNAGVRALTGGAP